MKPTGSKLMNVYSIVKGPQQPDLLHNETLADIFSHAVQAHAHHTALIFQHQSLTYTQLDHWSDAVAALLQSKGIGPGSVVGVWWPRGLELHAAILGIVKAGAAYVPLDREMPAERVEGVLTEVKAAACFSELPLQLDAAILSVPTLPDITEKIILTAGPQPDNMAYVLYTSGSTGKPKGIPISHRQICHLVRAEQTVLNIRTSDKVYQGFSVSFDMWCEETWLSYFVGATLWVADATTAKAIDELGDVLRREKITVLHAVPSLLAIMEDNIPSLRLINAGGEACTPQVLARWAAPPRLFYNSYGPTETTVSATFAALKPGDYITIGQPLPNYNMAVVDEKLDILPVGERGELVISGPGVGAGYIDRPELTHEKFVDKPASMSALPGDRLYRTGDAAIILPDGSIDFQGRLDDQIKLRGYRIELGEIENQLHAIDGVAAAAVAVKKDSNDQDQLVGYIVREDDQPFDESSIRSRLAKVLPPYMVPGIIVELDDMPRLPSGKMNRKALPVPAAFTQITTHEAIDPNAPLQDRITTILAKVFPDRTIDLQQDFFTDLGGHSLLAAAFVSRLRREANVPQASLKDIYIHRPLQELVNVWAAEKQAGKQKGRVFNKIPWWRHLSCWIAQTIALLVIFGLFAMQIYLPYLGYYYVEQATSSLGYAILTALGMFCLLPPLFSILIISTKWLVIGKMKAGDYPLWGTYYFRWWLVKTIQRLMPSMFLNGTPLYPAYLRLLGVKIAADAQLGAITIGAEDLLTIGSDVSISSQAVINNAFVEDGLLKLRTVHLGDHAYVGSSAIIGGNTVMEAWSELQDLSYLPPDSTIASGEVWQGSPAELKVKKAISELPQPLPVSAATRRKYSVIFSLFLLVFPFTVLLPLLPTIVTLNQMDNAAPDYNFNYMVITPALALSYIILFTLQTVVLTRLLQWGIKPGTYPIYSAFYARKWFADQLMSLSLIVIHPIFATVYISSLFRALGAKIGRNTEVSTASSVTHPLLEIGDGAFIADAVTLGESDVRGQQLILEKTIIHNTSFVGNSALIPQGYELPENMLIGVLSTPPSKDQLSGSNARDWFGSPAIALPRRQESRFFPPELTTNPSPQRRLARAIVEFIRILIPETVVICCSILFIAYAHDLVTDKPWWMILLQFPFYYLFFLGLPAFLFTVVLKWVLIGVYRPLQSPMWTSKVWRSEAITSTYEALSIPFLLEYLKGTPWLPSLLRLLGVKAGFRVWLFTADITEFDMVEIGTDTALNEDSGPQTHLFEDRVMKVGPIKIGRRSSVGARSIILYDSEIGDDVNLAPLSLVMKGEKLQSGTDWTGSPVKPD
ncbi:non-ribosomal peptide synthetase-like protein [Chitinophaga niastensis]|uniref:Non-ribosomal peptide synthetase-like protein n=1 Tax=Chitinophaga niastensis TaxID=536980 RepID=A0A2P8HVM4_CHINA|nr:Pls/PosA family non-ribosomal peptide synthetase [Chitinophaga niastensis]PSL50266.1 non-ribosomal peptide synthetase-like protein [Chitinophaga niastensis]